MVIDLVVEIGGRTPRAADRAGQFLHIGVAAGIEPAHVVPVHEINFPLLAATDQQMRMGRAADRIWQQQGAARAEIAIVRL